MVQAPGDLNYAIVAFVDILGFSEMVKSDCENQNGSLKFFEILKNINQKTKKISGCNITQFSDSVIFSLPLNNANYLKMIQILADYQYELLCNSIICRGAMAYGKHYVENDFMFSQALIEAYQLETKEAKYPRIIISSNLKEFFEPEYKHIVNTIKEKDGYFFIDYLKNRDKDRIKRILKKYNSNINNHMLLSIREKYYWLFEYWEFAFGERLTFNQQKFEDRNIYLSSYKAV